MAEEPYRVVEIVVDINDAETIARAERVEKRITQMFGQFQRLSSIVSRQRIAPVIEVKDRLTEGVLKADKLIKRLDAAKASPVIEARDRTAVVIARINAAIEALESGKVEVVADMKGTLMDEVARAKQALDALGDVKAGPVADLRGELLGQVAKAQSLLGNLDQLTAKPQATLADRVSGVVKMIGSGLLGLTSRVWTITVRAKDLVTGALRGIWRTVTSPLGMLGIGVSGAAITAATIIKPLQLAGQMEQAKIGFETMLGSGEKAAKFLKDLQRFAALTPFEFPELQDASKRLLAFGFSAEQVLPTMTAIGNAASGLGIGAEGINRLILAIGQMRAKGKVTGEEMRQLTEAGIPAWDMLAQAMGRSTGAVMKMSEKGLIPASKAIDILIEGMNQRFPNMMERQSRSLMGLWSTIKDAFNMNILLRWGEGLSSVIKPRLERLVDALTRNEDVTRRWGGTLEHIAQQAGERIMSAIEKAFNTIDRLLKDPRFQKADLFGKTEILWDEIIAKPFEEWWTSGGASWAASIGARIGGALGKAVAKGIMDVILTNPITGAIFGIWAGGAIGGPMGALIGGLGGLGWGTGSWLGRKIFGRPEEISGTILDLQAMRQMAQEIRAKQPQADTRQRFFEQATQGALAPSTITSFPTKLPSLVPIYGMGGIVTKPQFSLVGDSGPEAIVPLTQYRERAISLWQDVARWLRIPLSQAGAKTEKPIPGKVIPFPLSLPESERAKRPESLFATVIAKAASLFGIPQSLLKGLIHVESGWRPEATSRAGAIGLTQVMPETARGMGYDPKELARNPALQIEAGAKYLSQQIKTFGDIRLALAAYNAGPSAVRQHEGIPPYPETIEYVSNVLKKAQGFGYSSALPRYAAGTIAARPQLALVGEEGPEAIIPLSVQKRERALGLWREAGEFLGIPEFREGAVPELLVPPAQNRGGAKTTIVNIYLDGQVIGTVQVNGKEDLNAVAEQAADIVADNIRKALEAIA